MKSADLQHRVAFYEVVPADDGSHGTVDTLTLRFEEAAFIRYLRGGETVQASRLQGRQPAVITVRANGQTAPVTTAWTIRDIRRNVDYQIRGAVPTDDRRFIEFTCEGGVAL